jgi:hypothetical protein
MHEQSTYRIFAGLNYLLPPNIFFLYENGWPRHPDAACFSTIRDVLSQEL